MSHPTKTSASTLSEFQIIERYFAPLASQVALGLKDDAACFTPPPGHDLIVSKDVLVADRHFFADDAAADIAFKALSVNVSDLAAKGATPQHYLLGLVLPKEFAGHHWLKGFAYGLESAQKTYGIHLVGGDTVATEGPLCISITAIGYAVEGAMIKRSEAKAGDDIYVSGTLGDAAFGLQAIKTGQGQTVEFSKRYHRPTARPELGKALQGIASAAADVSDGLLADARHICQASGIGARLFQAKLPLSEAGVKALEKDATLWPLVFSGGDDYEIVFMADPSNAAAVKKISQTLGLQITKIGVAIPGSAVELVDCTDKLVQVAGEGFEHF